MMRLNQALLPSPEGRACRHSPDSSSRRIPCRGLVQVIARIRSVNVHSATRCTLLASLSLLLSSPVMVHSSCQVPPLQRVTLSFAPASTNTTTSEKCRHYLCFTHPDANSLDSQHVSHHLVVACGIHGMQNTNPANVQCSCGTQAETRFHLTSAQFSVLGGGVRPTTDQTREASVEVRARCLPESRTFSSTDQPQPSRDMSQRFMLLRTAFAVVLTRKRNFLTSHLAYRLVKWTVSNDLKTSAAQARRPSADRRPQAAVALRDVCSVLPSERRTTIHVFSLSARTISRLEIRSECLSVSFEKEFADKKRTLPCLCEKFWIMNVQ